MTWGELPFPVQNKWQCRDHELWQRPCLYYRFLTNDVLTHFPWLPGTRVTVLFRRSNFYSDLQVDVVRQHESQKCPTKDACVVIRPWTLLSFLWLMCLEPELFESQINPSVLCMFTFELRIKISLLVPYGLHKKSTVYIGDALKSSFLGQDMTSVISFDGFDPFLTQYGNSYFLSSLPFLYRQVLLAHLLCLLVSIILFLSKKPWILNPSSVIWNFLFILPSLFILFLYLFVRVKHIISEVWIWGTTFFYSFESV